MDTRPPSHVAKSLSNNGFLDLAEYLWSAWLRDELEVPPFVRNHCDPEASPEPYLVWGAAERPLVVLTTNPGATLPHQLRKNILAGNGVARPDEPYAAAARRLADWYKENLGGAARRRLDGMLEISEQAGYDGVVQVELCPFHSPSFDRKREYVREHRNSELLRIYTEALTAFLRERPVIGLSAVPSSREIDASLLQASPWLTWQAEVMGLSGAAPRTVPLVSKGDRVTCGALNGSAEPNPKAMVLMMGGNHLPGRDGRRRLAELLRAQPVA